MKNKIKTMPQRKNPLPKRPELKPVERVAAVIRDNRLIMPGDRVMVAVSGGPDSLALLYLLRAIDIPMQLIAAYIDHGLRPLEIPNEVNTLKACCCALDVPFLTRSVDVHGLLATKKCSPEEAARILRYEVLEELRREHRAEVIATGHTADDQVEEFFLRLIRGSGRRGLSGMAIRRDRIIRPLLNETKASLTDFLAANRVSWCVDSSNLERHFLRNRVRLDLLPLLEKEFNPSIRRTIRQNMNILAEEEEYLERRTEEVAALCIKTFALPEDGKPPQLAVLAEPFFDQHPAIRRRVLEQCFIRMGIQPAYGQIDTIAEFLARDASGGEIHLDDGVRVEKRKDQLLFCRPLEPGRKRGKKAALPAIALTVAGPGRYFLPEHGQELIIEETESPGAVQRDGSRLLVDRARVVFPLVLRSAQPGETFHPFNSPGRKKISRYFNDRKIPAHERIAWPVLLSDDNIVALAGIADRPRLPGDRGDNHACCLSTGGRRKIAEVSDFFPQNPFIADPHGDLHPIEILEDGNGKFAGQTGQILKGRGIDLAVFSPYTGGRRR